MIFYVNLQTHIYNRIFYMWKILFVFLMNLLLFSCMWKTDKVNEMGLLEADSLFLLVGSYASLSEEGIKLFTFNTKTGKESYVSGLSGINNPSYLIPSSDGTRVYAVGENSISNSTANSISLDLKKGKLTLLNTCSTQGAAPCYIAMSPEEDFVLTANYNGGNISIFKRDKQGMLMEPRVIGFTGSGVDKERQDKPYLHCIGFTPDGKYLVAVDLGVDCLHVFPVNSQNRDISAPFLDEDKPYDFMLPPGCGPRHLCFSPSKRFCYLMTELSGEVIVLEYLDQQGKIVQVIKADTLDAGGGADIHISPDGKYLYASTRLKGDGIAIFKVNEVDGTLVKVGYQLTGIHPRNFVISPDGDYLLVACRDTNEIQIFNRDQLTGKLTNTGRTIKVSKPTCLKFIEKK